MGDQWEEDRLEQRDSFLTKHRLILDEDDSTKLADLRCIVDDLMDELIEHVKALRAPLTIISRNSEVAPSDSLRSTYAKLIREPAIVNLENDLKAELHEMRHLAIAFGDAIAEIMSINRCIVSINKNRLDLVEHENRIHRRAVALLPRASDEFSGQTLEIQLASSALILIKPGQVPQLLRQVELGATIYELIAWKAVGD